MAGSNAYETPADAEGSGSERPNVAAAASSTRTIEFWSWVRTGCARAGAAAHVVSEEEDGASGAGARHGGSL